MLSIEEALALARANSEMVRIRGLEAGKAGDRLTQARARAFPSVVLEASGSWLADPPEGITLEAGELGTIPLSFPPWSIPLPSSDTVFVADAEHTYFTLDVSVSQPLFTWGKIAGAIAIAERELAAAGAEMVRQQRDIEKQAHAAYFGALLAEGSRAVLDEMRVAAEAVVTDRKRSLEEGAATRQEVLEAEATFSSVEAGLVEAGEKHATALESLSLLIGAQAGDIVLASGFRGALPALDEPSLKSAALAGSPRLSALRERAGQARARLSLEKGGALLRPDFSLAVTLGVTGQSIPWTSSGWTDTWDWDLRVSLGTRATLFDAGASAARIGEAGKDVEAVSLAIAQLEKSLGVEVRTAVQEARRRNAALAAARAEAAFREEQARNARISFDNELATREEMNSASLALLRSRLELLRAGYEMEDAMAEIEYLSGQSLGGR